MFPICSGWQGDLTAVCHTQSDEEKNPVSCHHPDGDDCLYQQTCANHRTVQM